jgi:AcrR family transcriptional regulator
MAEAMTPTRRMGSKESDVRLSMLDAAEDTLRDEGYGALTSRRVAERIGVKQRLVYYYFASMDELIVETFRRLAIREIDRLAQALASAAPLREMWAICIQSDDTKLVSEFMALANRNHALCEEVRIFIDESRRLQVAALSASVAGGNGERSAIAPVAAVIFATSAALALHREAAIGLTTGHAQVIEAIAAFLETHGDA